MGIHTLGVLFFFANVPSRLSSVIGTGPLKSNIFYPQKQTYSSYFVFVYYLPCLIASVLDTFFFFIIRAGIDCTFALCLHTETIFMDCFLFLPTKICRESVWIQHRIIFFQNSAHLELLIFVDSRLGDTVNNQLDNQGSNWSPSK